VIAYLTGILRINLRGLDKITELYYYFPVTIYPQFAETSTHFTPHSMKVIAVSLRSLTIAISKREYNVFLPRDVKTANMIGFR
jgi:hypothetical protein